MAAEWTQSRVMYWSTKTLLNDSLSRPPGSSVADLGVGDGALEVEVATGEADPGASLDGPAVAIAGVAAMAEEIYGPTKAMTVVN